MDIVHHDLLTETTDFLVSQGFSEARYGIIWGTGFSACVEAAEQKAVVPYGCIPHFPVSTVQNHLGNFIFGSWGQNSVIMMQGRIHLYEGYNIQQIAYPLEVMHRFGVEVLIVTNAAGGLSPSYDPGDLMIVQDHIYPIGQDLIGALTLYPESDPCYNASLRRSLLQISIQKNTPMQQGILAWMPGPSFETRAEIALLKLQGADAVTMSTVPEVLAGYSLGMRTAAISCIANVWNGHCEKSVDLNNLVSTVESSAACCIDVLGQLLE